ncbi:phosphatase PAP2 family protein [Bacillus glycinifermentans]|uniref:phosphatase PAP2 family protein n=1 Tax=Bacillus glycinifermentans TaxID=1664069 RepID=UPI00398B6A03
MRFCFFFNRFLFLLFHKNTGWLWLILAFAAGISRIWSGVHYPFDVAVGAILGMFSALFVFFAAPKLSFINRLLAQYIAKGFSRSAKKTAKYACHSFSRGEFVLKRVGNV